MSDNVLAGIVAAPPPLTIEEVILRMEQIDDVLPINDGLKWFNVLYLLVTRAVKARSPTGGWGTRSGSTASTWCSPIYTSERSPIGSATGGPRRARGGRYLKRGIGRGSCGCSSLHAG